MLFTREQIHGLYYLLTGLLIISLFPLLFGEIKGGDVDLNLVVEAQDSLLHDSLFMPPSVAEIRERREPLVKVRPAKLPIKIELNKADSAELVSLKGVGGYYASKIINYRGRLGGFFDVRQLKELNLTYLNVDSISRVVTVNKEYIVKRCIGDCEFKALLRHPYLDYETLVMIFDYKREFSVNDTLTIKKLSAAGILRSTQAKKLSYYFY